MPKKEKPTLSPIHGKVLAFNISPKGRIEGALLEAPTGPIQINFPRHHAEALAQSMRVGAEIEIRAEREPHEGEHPVYLALVEDDETGGKIVRLNYALQGEVNGYHLGDGTYLHVKPEGAKKYKMGVGDEVKARGTRLTGTDAVVVEVHELHKLGKHAEVQVGA